MRVNLPQPKQGYDYTNEVELRRKLEAALNDALSSQTDITLQPGQKLILTSPAGNKFYITVDDAGVLGTSPA